MIAAAVLASFWGDKMQRLLEAHDSDKGKVVVNKGGYYLPLLIGDAFFLSDTATNVDATADIDTGSLEAGKDYYVYACDNSGALVFKTSLASTYPAGFDANTSRKIGGFHTLCADVGTISGHTLSGYLATNILPQSIWDLKHRSRGLQAGMYWNPDNNLWESIYLASDNGASGVESVNGATILDTLTWNDTVDRCGKVGCRLMTDHEFQRAAEGSNAKTNISGSADPVTTGGHVDTASRRMISNYGAEDCCGVILQWLLDQSYRWDADGTMSAASKTLTIYHAASPSGNPIYVKYANGRPYLCCNMATDAADKWLTFGGAVTVMVKHDADAATGGYQVYFDEDATQPSRILCALPGLKTDYIDTSDPNYPLKITYNAAPATPGVAITYDDGADERMEFISPTSSNGTVDLASYSLTFSFYDVEGSKGSIYKQSVYGDVKLVAGGHWINGTACGPRCRRAGFCRWSARSDIGCRFASEPV